MEPCIYLWPGIHLRLCGGFTGIYGAYAVGHGKRNQFRAFKIKNPTFWVICGKSSGPCNNLLGHGGESKCDKKAS
jgi:hypothetical protein